MDTTIVFDAAQKAQVINPLEDPVMTLALAVLFVGLLGVLVYVLKQITSRRTAREQHVAYKYVSEHPAITKLRTLRYR